METSETRDTRLVRLINSIIGPDWIIFSGDEGKKKGRKKEKGWEGKKITHAASRRCNAVVVCGDGGGGGGERSAQEEEDDV